MTLVYENHLTYQKFWEKLHPSPQFLAPLLYYAPESRQCEFRLYNKHTFIYFVEQ